MSQRNYNLDRLRAYQSVFSGPDGDIVLEDLKNAHHMRGPLVPNLYPQSERAIDPLLLAMREG